VFGHAGAIPGYLSTLRHYPRSGVTFALQINTDGPFAGGADAGEVMAALEEAMASHLVPAARGPEASDGRSPAHPPNHPSG
jgi:D-alanyl-D-alanine carboxypeptidase